jgi:hypothetical protein
MPTVVQFRRGTTTQNNNFTGADGEISVDTTLHVLRVADGATPGGFPLVGQDCVQTIANKTYTGTLVSVTGNVTGAYIIGNGSQLTGLPAGYTNANVVSLLSAFGSNSISTTGNITAANLNSSNADLAEMYSADNEYAPGTLVMFGGNQEITITTSSHCTQVAGIVSTNPSYLMNSAQTGNHVLPVALTGRVPCQVVGTIVKGDRLVSSDIAGVATTLDKSLYEPGCIVGKALENYQSVNVGVIEVAVGRF